MRKLLVALLSLVVALTAAEWAVRRAPWRFGVRPRRLVALRAFLEDPEIRFRPHPYVGFVVRDSEDPTDTTRPRSWAFDRPRRPDVPRVACLGGSTTYGDYPRLLQEILVERLGREVEVMNWGVPGWSTMETMVNYFVNVQDYEPDVVVVHHATNDVAARIREGFRNDYAHWRRPWIEPDIGPLSGWLVQRSDLAAAFGLRGFRGVRLRDLVEHPFRGVSPDAPAELLPPGTGQVFARNVRTICQHVTLRGGEVVLHTMPYDLAESRTEDGESLNLWTAALDEHNQFLHDLAAERGYALADSAAAFLAEPETSQPLFFDRVHMQRSGQRWKATIVADAILEAGYLAAGDAGSARSR